MHYTPSVAEAFNSVEHILRDVNNGWLVRYLHTNTASAFFFILYLHIGRGLYYGSYKAPRTLTWIIGTVMLILMMATAFLGYVLPYGQMSLWGATVITNLMSAIPWIGQDIVEFIWGGFSVNNATLNRFFALHFLLLFVLAALVVMHLIAYHDVVGSGNLLGISGNYDRLPFVPYFVFKDLITIFIFFIILSVFVFFMPNALGDSENYIMANPMQTPPAIVPEWYLLPDYLTDRNELAFGVTGLLIFRDPKSSLSPRSRTRPCLCFLHAPFLHIFIAPGHWFITNWFYCRSVIMNILIKSCGQSIWFDERVLRDSSDFFAPFLDDGWKVSEYFALGRRSPILTARAKISVQYASVMKDLRPFNTDSITTIPENTVVSQIRKYT